MQRGTAHTGYNIPACGLQGGVNFEYGILSIYIYYILSLQLNRPLRNTGITFAFCSGYFSLDVEELSSKKQLLKFCYKYFQDLSSSCFFFLFSSFASFRFFLLHLIVSR